MSGERLADAGLAAGGLAAVVAVALGLGVPGRPSALAAGVAGALVLEFVLARRRTAVRQVWARQRTKAAAAAVFLAGLALAALLAPAVGLSLLAGGLVGYLALLGGVAIGDLARGAR